MYTPADAEHDPRQSMSLSWCEELGEGNDGLSGSNLRFRSQTIRTAAELYHNIRSYAAVRAITVTLEEGERCVVLDRP